MFLHVCVRQLGLTLIILLLCVALTRRRTRRARVCAAFEKDTILCILHLKKNAVHLMRHFLCYVSLQDGCC